MDFINESTCLIGVVEEKESHGRYANHLEASSLSGQLYLITVTAQPVFPAPADKARKGRFKNGHVLPTHTLFDISKTCNE